MSLIGRISGDFRHLCKPATVYFVLRAQYRRGHFGGGTLRPVLDLDSAFDVSHRVRFHILVNGYLSARAVFCSYWIDDAGIIHFGSVWEGS